MLERFRSYVFQNPNRFLHVDRKYNIAFRPYIVDDRVDVLVIHTIASANQPNPGDAVAWHSVSPGGHTSAAKFVEQLQLHSAPQVFLNRAAMPEAAA